MTLHRHLKEVGTQCPCLRWIQEAGTKEAIKEEVANLFSSGHSLYHRSPRFSLFGISLPAEFAATVPYFER